MLKFTLIDETRDSVVYKYFPENSTNSGVISYDKNTNNCSIITLPETDRHQRYAQKMFSKIKEYAINGSFEKEGIVAWY